MVNPASFGRAIRIKRYAATLAKEKQLADAWQVELAAMLSQIGCVTIPTSVMSKLDRGWTLTTYEQKWYDPTVLQQLAIVLGVTYRGEVQTVGLNELRAGMILAEDMRLGDGRLLLARGQEVTDALMRRLKNTPALIGRNPKFCVYNTAQPENP